MTSMRPTPDAYGSPCRHGFLKRGPCPAALVGMLFRFGMPALMFENARLELSDQRLKTTLVAGVFEFSVALLGRTPHPAHLSALPERATLNQALSEISRDIWRLDVETDLTLWCIGSRVRRRPIQTGDHKMIIIP